jgi:hypothetical protein
VTFVVRDDAAFHILGRELEPTHPDHALEVPALL